MYEKSFINIDFPLKRIKTNVLNGHKYQSKMGELIFEPQRLGDKIKVFMPLKVAMNKEEATTLIIIEEKINESLKTSNFTANEWFKKDY